MISINILIIQSFLLQKVVLQRICTFINLNHYFELFGLVHIYWDFF